MDDTRKAVEGAPVRSETAAKLISIRAHFCHDRGPRPGGELLFLPILPPLLNREGEQNREGDGDRLKKYLGKFVP